MDRPVIGLTAISSSENPTQLRMHREYTAAVIAAGGLPVVLPLYMSEAEMEKYAELCSGFIITGGDDFDPAVFGQEVINDTVVIDKDRNAIEFPLFRILYSLKKPVFGICRGIQLINIALGGTLIQDIPAQRPSDINHRIRPYDDPCHFVTVADGNIISRSVGSGEIFVNSCHHQAADVIAPSLEVCALAPDGIVEALCSRERENVFGVQWHPERLFEKDPRQLGLFESLVKMCV